MLSADTYPIFSARPSMGFGEAFGAAPFALSTFQSHSLAFASRSSSVRFGSY